MTYKKLTTTLFLFIALAGIPFWVLGATRTASISGNWNSTSTWGGQSVPGSGDDVIINNGITVTVNVTASCATITMNSGANATSLVISSSNFLSVIGAVLLNPGTANGANRVISIGSGAMSCSSLTMGNTGNNNRYCQVSLSTGTCTVAGNIVMNGTAARSMITFTGAGTLNAGGSISGGDIIPSTGTVVYNGSVSQTIAVNADYVYYNLHSSNSAGASLQDALTTANLTGNLRVLTGTFNNNGFAITGNLSRVFEISSGATFFASGTSTLPTGFGTFTLSTTSTVEFGGSGDQAIPVIASPGYGNLQISGTGNKTAMGSLMVAGNFSISAASFILNSATSYTLTIAGNYSQTGGIFDFNNGLNVGASAIYLAGNLTHTSGISTMTTSGNYAPNGLIYFNGNGIQTISMTVAEGIDWVKYYVSSGKSLQLLSNLTLTSADPSTQAPYTGEMNVSGTINLGNYTVTTSGGVTGSSEFKLNAGARIITGNALGIPGSFPGVNMSITLSSSADYEFNGASTGIFSTSPLALTVNNLLINSAGNVTLSTNLTVSGTLSLINGRLDLNTSVLTLASANAVSGGPFSSSRMVIAEGTGVMRKTFSSVGSFLFPVGTVSLAPTYTPVTFNMVSGTMTNAYIDVRLTDLVHPLVPDASDYITRFWTISQSGITNPVYNVDLTYAESDVVGNESLFFGAKYDPAGWSYPSGSVNTSTNIVSLTGMNSFSDFTAAGKLSVTAQASPTTVCSGSPVSLTAQPARGVPPYTFSWSSNPVGFSSSAQNPTHNPTGNITYSVTVTDARSNSAVAGVSVTVNPMLTAGISVSPSINPVCNGTEVVFTATPVNGGVSPSFQWKLNGNNVGSNLSTFSSSALSNGDVIHCILTSSETCITGSPATSNVVTMTIYPLPSFTYTTTQTCVGSSTGTITASGTGGEPPYLYRINTGTYQSSGTFTGLAAGNYTITVMDNRGCVYSGPVTVSLPTPSGDDQTVSGNDTWLGHAYDGTAFNTYYGHFTENETFDESFGGDYNCFAVTSGTETRYVYTEQFSVRFRMTSSRKGLFVVNLGSDDGSRLTVDGNLIYNNWVDQGFTTRSRVLISLTGNSNLVYEFYENAINNRVIFQSLTSVLTNTLTTNTTQQICQGSTGLAISGDTYGTLPTGIALSGTGYQWTYSTTPTGTRTNLSGATGATFTPVTSVAPFNVPGTYYIYRNAILQSTNNVSPNPYIATNESNPAIIQIDQLPTATISYPGSPYCTSQASPQPVSFSGTIGGTYSSAPGLSINPVSGEITPSLSASGTYNVFYTIPPIASCDEVVISTTATITLLPVADFTYTGSPYCPAGSDPLPVFANGGVAGLFSSTPGLSFVNTSTGEIDLSASTPGTYAITNTIAPSAGCSAVSSTSWITINPDVPPAPGSISGVTNICQGVEGLVYSISAVPGATSYLWSVPVGWTVTGGTGTTSIIVTAGNFGQNGTISVSAVNFCGTSESSSLSVDIYPITLVATQGTEDGCYPTLKAAFDKINDGTHQGLISIMVNGNTTETTSATLNGSGVGSAVYNSVTVFPTTNVTINGNFSGSLISLNQADSVVFDGRINMLGEEIGMTISQIESSNAATRTIQLMNGATNNIFRYCNIYGAASSASAGMIFFSTSTEGTGNNSNLFEFCNFSGTGTNRPVNCFFSSGTAGADNTGNIIQNNRFYDLFRNNASSNILFLSANTSDWTISGNSFYEMGIFNPAGGYTYRAVYISNTSGGGFSVSGNFIGGREAECGGLPWTITGNAHIFYGIEMNVGTSAASSIQDNMIANFTCTSTAAAPWQAIRITGGLVNIGTVEGNTIGSSVGTGSISLSNTSVAATGYGIYISSTGNTIVSANNIGSITTSGSASVSYSFFAVYKAGTGTFTAENNTIGSLTTPLSIQASSSVTSSSIQNVYGIYSAGTGTVTITDNTISNLYNAFLRSTSSGQIAGVISTSGVCNISGNSISYLSSSSPSIGTTQTTASVVGIGLSSTSPGQIIGENVILYLENTRGASRAVQVYGIIVSNGTVAGENKIRRNYISGLRLNGANTSTTAAISGIRLMHTATSAAIVSTSCENNIIYLGTDVANPCLLQGIYEAGYSSGTSACRNSFSFNTVLIDGASTGTTLTYAFFNNSTGSNTQHHLRDNVLYNSRSSPSGSNYHFAIRLSTTNGVSTDYNDLFVDGTGGTLARLGTTNYSTLSSWRTALASVAGDVNSISTNPLFINPALAVPEDFMLTVNLPGTPVTGIIQDFGGNTRAAIPTMGAWEKLLRRWKGSLSNDFATGGNWSDGVVPVSGEDILFDDNPDRDCYLDGSQVIGSLTINQAVDKLVLNGNQLTVTGSLNFTAGGQINASFTGSNLVCSGTVQQTIPSGAFVDNTVYDLTVSNSSGVTVSGDLEVTGTLSMTAGVLSIGNNTLILNGCIQRVSGMLSAGPMSTVHFKGSGPPCSVPAGAVSSGILANLTIERSSGILINEDMLITGTLNLATANPGVSVGCLETGSHFLTMDENATTVGPGDVSGNVRRSYFVEGVSYSFGNQYTTLIFQSGGTMPSELIFRISLGSQPTWKPDALHRIYDIIRSGGSNTGATLSLHYLDSELNTNPESYLHIWDYQPLASPVWLGKRVRIDSNTISNWISTSINDISIFATSAGEHTWTIGGSLFATLSGTKGWRMITSATQTTCSDLLTGFITQGVPGSSYPGKQPNFLWFDETDTLTTNMSWRSTNMSDSLKRGRGYYLYVFDSVSGPFTDTLPRTLSSAGNAWFAGSFNYSGLNQPVTFTNRVGGQSAISPYDTVFYDTNVDDEGWNLLGNPTTSTLNWDAAGAWTKSNIDNTIYIWDPALNQFRVWNGFTGTMGSGLICPYQAFWVRANNVSPQLGFSSGALTTGGTFYGGTATKDLSASSGATDIQISLNDGFNTSSSLLSFMEEAIEGPDRWDAYRLEPLSDTWLDLYSLASPAHTLPLVINSIPWNGDSVMNFPLYAGKVSHGDQMQGTFTLHWSLPALWPTDWAVSLHDHHLKKAISMNQSGSYDFIVENLKSGSIPVMHGDSARQISLPDHLFVPASKQPGLKNSESLPPFSILIEKGKFDPNPAYVALTPALLSPYPNPCSKSTTVRFTLPAADQVSIDMFDVYGRYIRSIANSRYDAGIHKVFTAIDGLHAGIYLLRFKTPDSEETGKLIIIE